MADGTAGNAEKVRQFNLALEQWAQKVPPDALATLHRRIALDALARITRRTPVRTGRLRRNNLVAVGATPEITRVGVDPTGATAQAEGEAVIGRVGPFQRVAIFNNVEYARYVEDGSSTQAPAGMYGVTFEELRTQFTRTK